jgi:uncharacterized membrane protein YdbT with pleckstrin-like domain
MRTRLRGGESVTAVVRRHWIALLGPFALALFLAGCLAAAFAIRRPYVVPAAAVAFLLAALWALWRWLVWSRDIWVVTTQRVIDESGVLNVRMTDSPLDKIHNVACEQPLVGRLFDFGTLRIQTAAEDGAAVIAMVARPREAKEAILEGQERYRTALFDRQAAPILAAARAAAPGPGGPAAAGPGAAAPAGAAAETKECPYCAETVRAKATVCRFCGRTI